MLWKNYCIKQMLPPPLTQDRLRYTVLTIVSMFLHTSGADPGFFLGGGALVSCSTSTPINHIVFFFSRIPVVLENRRSSQGGRGVRTPCTRPLDPPLHLVRVGRLPSYYKVVKNYARDN